MATIDELLEGLRNQDADPRLEAIDGAVMAGIAVRREKSAARRGLMLTSVLALGVGVFTSALSPQRARAEQPVVLNTVPPSAPSSLLMGTH
ncbi:MAG: hypothetical protein ABW169_15515 [Sphingobium sp.]